MARIFRIALGLLLASGLALGARADGQSSAVETLVQSRETAADPAQPSSLLVGWTHIHWSPDSRFAPENIAAAKTILRNAAPLQNTFIMGFGLPNPSPSQGQYDFSGLDRRIAMIRETGGQPMITLCCAPDWMKGGESGKTDWSRFLAAPLPEHYDDFASMAATIARRYPDVAYFQVWVEMHGFWHADLNRWNYEQYTTLYNKVFSAIKAVRPDARVGGPYVVAASLNHDDPLSRHHRSNVSGAWGSVDQRALDVLDYWLRNKRGADFVTLDGSLMPRRGGLSTSPGEALEKFASMTRWIRERTPLPIWWAELYPVPPGMHADEAPAQAMAALRRIAASGGQVALLWNPNCQDDIQYHAKGVCLWSDIRTSPLSPSAFAGYLDSSEYRRPGTTRWPQ